MAKIKFSEEVKSKVKVQDKDNYNLPKNGIFIVVSGYCEYCQELVDKLPELIKTDIKVIIIDMSDDPDVLQDLNLYGVPTLIKFKNGKEVKRIVTGNEKKVKKFINCNGDSCII